MVFVTLTYNESSLPICRPSGELIVYLERQKSSPILSSSAIRVKKICILSAKIWPIKVFARSASLTKTYDGDILRVTLSAELSSWLKLLLRRKLEGSSTSLCPNGPELHYLVVRAFGECS